MSSYCVLLLVLFLFDCASDKHVFPTCFYVFCNCNCDNDNGHASLGIPTKSKSVKAKKNMKSTEIDEPNKRAPL